MVGGVVGGVCGGRGEGGRVLMGVCDRGVCGAGGEIALYHFHALESQFEIFKSYNITIMQVWSMCWFREKGYRNKKDQAVNKSSITLKGGEAGMHSSSLTKERSKSTSIRGCRATEAPRSVRDLIKDDG